MLVRRRLRRTPQLDELAQIRAERRGRRHRRGVDRSRDLLRHLLGAFVRRQDSDARHAVHAVGVGPTRAGAAIAERRERHTFGRPVTGTCAVDRGRATVANVHHAAFVRRLQLLDRDMLRLVDAAIYDVEHALERAGHASRSVRTDHEAGVSLSAARIVRAQLQELTGDRHLRRRDRRQEHGGERGEQEREPLRLGHDALLGRNLNDCLRTSEIGKGRGFYTIAGS